MFCFKLLIVFSILHNFLLALESSDENTETDVKSEQKNIKWADCGDSNSTVRWEDVDIDDPIRLDKLLVGARYRILDEVKPGSYSKVEVWRVFNLVLLPVYVKIPCISKFGSCDYDICRVWDRDNFCNFQRNATQDASCGCPMTPKLVEGYNFKTRLPETRINTFASLFARGQYKLRWTWFDPRGNKIGCLEGLGNLELGA